MAKMNKSIESKRDHIVPYWFNKKVQTETHHRISNELPERLLEEQKL